MGSPVSPRWINRIDRRAFLRLAVLAGGSSLVAACSQAAPASPTAVPPAPTAAPAPKAPAAAAASTQAPAAAAPASWQADWDKLVEAARKEGQVSIVTRAGEGMRAWLRDFEAAYPGITVQHQQFPSPSQFVPKVTEEQKAGVFEWDLYQTYATVAMPALRPINALAPIRPLIFNRPDVMDDKNWTNGFEGGWQDNDKQFGYGFSYQVNGLCAINTDLVQTSDFKTLDDMANPKWKGKMAFPDVRSGKTYGSMSVVLEKRGEEFVRKLIIEQEPFFSQDIRQVVESVIRGRSVLALGIFKQDLREFVDQGLGKNIQLIDIPDLSYVASDTLFTLTKAPHPNAASVLATWVLSREGQMSSVKNAELPTRRTDIPSTPTEDTPKPGQSYINTASEDGTARSRRIQDLLTQMTTR